MDIRSLSHEVTPGTWVTCTMTGDTFEMEDQRNWTDASYKTYVRPLALPWPYTLKQGEPITQAVTLSISGQPPKVAASAGGKPVEVTLGGETVGKVPVIGLGVPAEEGPHALRQLERLKKLGARFLICELDCRRGDGLSELQAYRKLSEALGASVTLEIIIPGGMDPAADLAPVGRAVKEAELRLAAIEVFPAQDMKSVLPGSPWPEMPGFEAILGAARAAFPGVRLGSGMATYFTELNRKRPPAARLDFVTHTTCPIVHAADDRSVMETLEALPYVFLSTKAFMGEMPYHVGPSAIGCRENPYGKATTPNPDNRRTCLSRLDPRQRGLFNAAYTIGYAAACARGGVDALAMGAPTGPFGFVHRRLDGANPFYESQPEGVVYPAFHVMAALAADSGARLLEANSDGKSAVEAFAYRKKGKATVLWLANLTPTVQHVALRGAEGAKIAVLDEDRFGEAVSGADVFGKPEAIDGEVVKLGAYAVAKVTMN
jgi:D-apionolactonase